MSKQITGYRLQRPGSADEWRRYHDIRRRSLFQRYLPGIVYDPHHPDERRPENHPLVLVDDGRIVGTIRIDVLDDRRVAFRLVAIDEPLRGRGLGAELLRQAERYAAADLGRRGVVLYANQNALGFYLKQGYVRIEAWGEPPLDPNSVPVGKTIGA